MFPNDERNADDSGLRIFNELVRANIEGNQTAQREVDHATVYMLELFESPLTFPSNIPEFAGGAG